MSDPVRLEPVQTATAASSSPTGSPILPKWVGPICGALGAIGLAVKYFAPPHTVAHQVADWVLSACATVGPLSQGWRR